MEIVQWNKVYQILDGMVVSLSAAIILKEFFELFFAKSEKMRVFKIFTWLLYLIWQFIILHLGVMPWYTKLMINIVLIILTGIANYKGTFIRKVFFAIGLCALWTLSEIFVGFVFLFLNLHIEKFDILGSIVSKLLLIIVVTIVRRASKNTYNSQVSIKYNLIVGSMALGSILIVADLFYLSEKNVSYNTLPLELICSLILLFINIFIFRIYSELSEQIKLQKENAAYISQLELYNLYLNNKEEEIERNRRLRHDLKQYCIYLLKTFEEKEYKKGVDFLYELIEEKIDRPTQIANTDNIVVDAIINYKYPKMQENNIKFSLNLSIPTKIDVEDSDLAIILGNLLDNAIDATIKLPENKREIKLEIKWDLGNLFICLQNTYDGKLNVTRFGEIKTSKNDKNKHGFGLISVNKCIEKYSGMLTKDYDNKIFKVTVLLYSDF